ncbi:hypothetical protein PoB_006612600 [Plakobranchus ocellatus]|uniref:Secreted protein n=1 Tax=Plakobranchus ocellatus TaxID=259542 RepID=A0AAV4D6E1_9GAST|nr:hypothetical protein PoB_006612600 [Plakobranchus ocellatus]
MWGERRCRRLLLSVMVVVCWSSKEATCKLSGSRRELRIAWFAPSQTVMGVSAATSVNTFKYALRAIESSYLKGHYTKPNNKTCVLRPQPNNNTCVLRPQPNNKTCVLRPQPNNKTCVLRPQPNNKTCVL